MDDDCVVIETVSSTKRLVDQTIDILDDDVAGFEVEHYINIKTNSEQKTASKQIRNPFFVGQQTADENTKGSKKRQINENLHSKERKKLKKKKDKQSPEGKNDIVQELNNPVPNTNDTNQSMSYNQNHKKKSKKKKSKDKEKIKDLQFTTVGTNTEMPYFNISRMCKGVISDPNVRDGRNGLMISRATSPGPLSKGIDLALEPESSPNILDVSEINKTNGLEEIKCIGEISRDSSNPNLSKEILDVSNGLVLNELRRMGQKNIAKHLKPSVPEDYTDLKRKGILTYYLLLLISSKHYCSVHSNDSTYVYITGVRDLVSTYCTLSTTTTARDVENTSPNEQSITCKKVNSSVKPRKHGPTSHIQSSQVLTLSSSTDNMNEFSNIVGHNKNSEAIITKSKNTKKMWTLQEDTMLIEKLLQITSLNADEISSKVVRDNGDVLIQELGRVLSSIVGRWRGYLQPIILSAMHGKLNHNVVPEVFTCLIRKKVKRIEDVDWLELIKTWPFQTEESLKLVIRNANTSGKTQKNTLLYQKLKKLLPGKRKPISSKDHEFNIKIAAIYNNLINSKHFSKPKSSKHARGTSLISNVIEASPCYDIGSVSKLPKSPQEFLPLKESHSTPVKKTNWTLEEEKMFIKTIFKIKSDLSASHIDEKVAKELFPLIQTRVNRPVSSMTSHWFLILQPLILSNMYGKLDYPITAAIFTHLITQKVCSVNDVNWKDLLTVFPFQNERSLKAIVNRANGDSRVPPQKMKLYEKMHVLLQFYANKKITPQKMKANRDVISFYEDLMVKRRQKAYKTCKM